VAGAEVTWNGDDDCDHGGGPAIRCYWCSDDSDDTDLDPWHIHDWMLDRSDYEPCVCGAVMPEPPF
jgi:hypothetical protein